MNALLVYPELPLSFWSTPKAFLIGSAKSLYAPLGPLTVAALLPKEWDLRLVDLNIGPLTEDDWAWSDLVMLSGMVVQRSGFHAVIREAVRRGKTTVAGGPYPTMMPEELLANGCTFVVRGEAENTIEALLDAIAAGDTGRIIENGKKPDLAQSPVPRYDLVNTADYLSNSVQVTRGCPFRCEFCDIAGLFGELPRCKSPDQVVAELEHLYRSGARGDVFVADDNFIADKENAKAVCRKMTEWNRKRGKPFGYLTQTSINLAQDLEMIDLMTEANFGEVFIGIESPDKEVLAASRKHHNTRNPLLESVATIKKNGLSVIGSFIIGFDGEEKGAGRRICNFVEEADIPIAMPNILAAQPRTELWARLEKEGRLRDEQARHLVGEATFTLPNFVPTRPLEEVVNECIGIWDYLYDPPRFLARTYRFCLGVRPTRRAIAAAKGEAVPVNAEKGRPRPLKSQLADVCFFLRHIWEYGLASSCRKQFWAQIIGMWKQNPSRLKKYIVHCIQGAEVIRLRPIVRERLLAALSNVGAGGGTEAHPA